jgi:MFS family permease
MPADTTEPGAGAKPSLWRDRAFLAVWSASTISIFGSLITRTALPFAAILVLQAGPLEISAIRAAEQIAALIIGLAAGAWVDRLRRRPIMIWSDLGRAVLLGSIPVAFVLGILGMPQLIVVAFAAAILSTFFDVADRSYLPTIIGRERLVAANSALTATGSIAEFSAFGIGGFLIQLFKAPIAIAIDAVSFVVSAILLATIRRKEPPPTPVANREPVLREIRDGMRIVSRSPMLRALALAHGGTHILWGIFGTSYLLFATNELNLGPAAIGIIAGVGGIGSLAGSFAAPILSRRLGVGRSILFGMVGFTAAHRRLQRDGLRDRRDVAGPGKRRQRGHGPRQRHHRNVHDAADPRGHHRRRDHRGAVRPANGVRGGHARRGRRDHRRLVLARAPHPRRPDHAQPRPPRRRRAAPLTSRRYARRDDRAGRSRRTRRAPSAQHAERAFG